MTGATASAAGKTGMVPAPAAGSQSSKYLRADGTWAVPPDTDTTYGAATQSAAGLQSAADKKKLDGIGVLYKCSPLNAAHAPQKTMAFGSMELPAGTYIATGSAKHSKQSGICVIGIGISASSLPADNGQMIYGHEAYDVNKGSVTTIMTLSKTTIIYFVVWAASDFEITPFGFNAIKIK